ncbi:hypothetical protein A2U01_0052097, partial [Trifolium medium]|nr:hypothetical protein [Trifolium medium]
GPMVIGAGLGRKNHSSILRNCDRRGLRPLDARTDLQIRLGGPVGRILIVKKKYY